MKRKYVNIIRFIIEDCLPPVVRDLAPLNSLFSWLSGVDLKKCRQLRESIPTLTPKQLNDFYKDFSRIQGKTDNSQKCIEQIINNVIGRSVCDVGCGTGYLLNRISALSSIETLVGVDFSVYAEWKLPEKVEFLKHDIFDLPFEDNRFDTVISTHMLEHVLDIPAAVKELRRICSRRLIIVAPRERESIWSFNPHFHYFPYEYSFLSYLLPLPNQWQIKRIGRDYLYTESS